MGWLVTVDIELHEPVGMGLAPDFITAILDFAGVQVKQISHRGVCRPAFSRNPHQALLRYPFLIMAVIIGAWNDVARHRASFSDRFDYGPRKSFEHYRP